MSDARETILQAVRTFIRSATGLADAAVVIAGDEVPRPAMPYLTVQAIMLGASTSQDERRYDLGGVGGAQQERIRGHRRATVQVSGYGRDAIELLEQVRLSLEAYTARASIAATGISLRSLGPPQDMTDLRDSGFELASLLELEASYRLETAPVTIPAATGIHVDVTLDRTNPPADLTFDFTVS